MDRTTTRQYRVDHGLCPICGKESAPYYLCEHHRKIGMVSRMCDLMAKRGVILRHKEKGRVAYSRPDGFNGPDTHDFKWLPRWGGLKEGDKRLRPRLGRRPVDLDETLVRIFMDAGRPLSIEEVVIAWGRLRSKRKTESLSGDMTAIIVAQRRRDERNAKRAAIAAKSAHAA